MKHMISTLFILTYILGFSQNQSVATSQTIGIDVKGEKRALIVGISDYKEPNLKLNYAESDAALFREYLSKIENLPDENITYLYSNDEKSDTYAGALSIYNALDNLLETTKPEDLIYIYFAGHGDVVKKISRNEGYLLASDANASQNYKGTGGVVSLEDLNEYVDVLTNKGTKVVLVLDACHSGFAYKEGAQKNMETLNNNFLNSTKYFSCKPDQLSYESSDLKHGYFTYYLVLGLMGAADLNDSSLQYNELGQFLFNNVYNESDEKQTPLILTQNPRDVIKSVDPKEKKESMEIIKNSSKIKDILTSRSVETIKSSDNLNSTKNPIIKQFNRALETKHYYGTEQSAFEIYNNALHKNSLPKATLKKMRFSLIKVLSTSAQMLVNYYIGGNEILPKGTEFKKQAKNLSVCLDVMDKDALMRERIYTSQLFLEAYSVIRNKNYSNYNSAKEKLEQALKIEPRAAYIHNALGVIFNHEENYDSAYYHYNKAKELIPSWSYPINNIGTNYLDQYQYKTAKTYFNQSLNLQGSHNTANNNLGVIYKNEGKYLLAEYYYKKALEYEPKSVISLRNLGNISKSRGNIKQSKEWYQKAIDADSSNALVEYGLDNYIDDFNIDNKTAEKLLKDAITSEPYFSNVYTQYADFLRHKANKPKRLQLADSLYQIAIKNDPFNEWAYAGRGWLFSRLKDTKSAIASFEEGIIHNVNKPKSYYYAGNFYKSEIKDVTKAENYFLKAIAKDAYYMPAYTSLIDLYNDQKQQEKAIELLNNLIKKNNDAPDLWNLMGNSYFSKQDYKNAITAYKNAIKIDSTYAKAYSNLSYSLLQQKNYMDAEKFYLLANEYNPYKNKIKQYSDLLISMSRGKIKNGDLANAEALLKMAFNLEVNTTSSFALSEFYYLNNKSQQAFSITKNTIETNNSKTWEVKLLELAIKSAIENNDAKNASIYFKKLEATYTKPDTIIEVLYYNLNGDTLKAKTLLKDVNPLKLRDQFLKPKFSKSAIQQIKALL